VTGILAGLVASSVGQERALWLIGALEVHPTLLAAHEATRAVIAQALGILLLDDLLARVPSGAAYAQDRVAGGGTLFLDHGAVRTVTGVPTGALPEGQRSLTRALEALGYVQRETYDLSRLRMTGRSWCHADLPQHVPQYFVSELHAERFTPAFQEAAARVLASSRDPLAGVSFDRLAGDGSLPYAEAEALLPSLVGCFRRHHDAPALADYETLRTESDEMAWIATEGTVFNHATDRVDDVAALAQAERAAGRPIKDGVEISQSGRIIQTAHRAAAVVRTFAGGEVRTVPGSFFEFITRLPLPDGGGVDLAFDASNAQEIFTMTRGRVPG